MPWGNTHYMSKRITASTRTRRELVYTCGTFRRIVTAMAVSTDGRPPLPPFNPLDERFRADPYPFYHRYRAEDPVHWAGAPDHDGAGIWFLFRYMEVMAALR